MSRENGATSAYGTGPSVGYTFVFNYVIWFISMFIVITTCVLFWIKLIMKMPKYLTIQKPDVRQFSVSGFAAALKPNAFDGAFYKRWRAQMIMWLTTMNCYQAANGKPEQFTPGEEERFKMADNLFRGAVISALADKYVDSYITCTSAKELWDALDAKFGVSDAGSELYVMEQFFDYKMVENRPIVEQAHEIQALAKELEQF